MNKPKEIDINTVVIQNKNLDSTDLDGEKVMMNIDRGKYYGLNEVGSRIWELLEEPKQVSGLISTLLEEYDVDRSTCESSVLAFLSKLYDEELIEIV